MFIDFEKAFVSLEWTFRDKSWKLLNFGPRVTRLIKVFYKDIQSCTVSNGLCSQYFTIILKRSGQGDLLSPYLSLIAVEILAIAVKTQEI